ncbi:hypothetical protein [Haloactinopolyspora sp.]|uniref:hypothetical protein n=1 Tax=Haloactinopolyspora sp. TaxID=1966353 RepID=UPI00260C8DB5|nr:hypothetical protein [Haloactinopolyspora sp.]
MALTRPRLLTTLAALSAAVAAPLLVAHGTGNAENAATQVTGCAIRFTSSGPEIHENASHRCTGASSVRVQADGDLEIRQTSGAPIVSVTVEEDETLSTRGIVAGPSGGTGTTIVRFFATRSKQAVRADSPALQGAQSNIWVTWVQAG